MPKNTSASGPVKGRRKTAGPKEDPDFSGIIELARSLNAMQKQMADICAPLVSDMIQNQCRDPKQIEHLLDRLLDCACVPEGLALFKSLCRYYYPLNPAAVANYVDFYREIWDSPEDAAE